jgi:hypothetical protein
MANLLLLKTDMTKLPKHGTGGQTMKFRKDGKVYANMVVAVYDYCNGLKYCYGCKLYGKTGDCLAYAQLHPKEVARLLGYEVIEDKPDTEKGVIMNNERKMSILLNEIGQMACDAEDKGKIDFDLCLTVEDAYALCHAASHTDNTPDIREVVEEHSEDAKADPVNRPAHYTSGGIECIDAMQAAFGAEAVKDFCLCNAFKYLWRHRNKNGVEDLKKARWYLNRLIREMEVTDDE